MHSVKRDEFSKCFKSIRPFITDTRKLLPRSQALRTDNILMFLLGNLQ